MYNGNGRPLNKKKQVQLMVALTILAWATQTLRHQWGFGADVDMATAEQAAAIDVQAQSTAPTTAPADPDDAAPPQESFVPGQARFAAGATLELRSEATIVGGDVKLKQICRWTHDDGTVFAPVADFVITHMKPGIPFRTITIAQLKSTLHDAGINLAMINVVGASACTVARSDAVYDEHTALEQWINAKQGNGDGANGGENDSAAATQPASPSQSIAQPSSWAGASAQGVTVSTTPASAALGGAAIPASETEQKQYHTLRELLTNDLATRTNLPVDQLEMNFHPEDEKVLNLSEPTFRFQIDPLRARNLGSVAWDVTVLAGGESHRVTINAEGRAWEQQLVLTRPVESRQIIQSDDFIQRRTLVDSLPNEPLLTRDQMVNEQADQSLKPGTVMTAQMVDAVPLVKSGQFVTVTVTQGGVQIQTVATALESGSFGQTIRVRNEETRDVFEVTMTGPQTATMNAASRAAAGSSSSQQPVASAQ
jgi:flagella basal body P-ring formation protein FlgA